jgi:translation initiation factor 5
MEFTTEIYLASRETHLNDPTFRYKIKPLNIKLVGKQDNWTTLIINSDEIAKLIKRPIEHISKYISHALSCPTKKEKEYNCLGFKGNYTSELITKYFMDYVKIYVLCPNCDLPETILFIQKEKDKPKGLSHICNACGKISLVKVNSIDRTFEYIFLYFIYFL